MAAVLDTGQAQGSHSPGMPRPAGDAPPHAAKLAGGNPLADLDALALDERDLGLGQLDLTSDDVSLAGIEAQLELFASHEVRGGSKGGV